MITRARLVEDLRSAGLGPGSEVLVHSSLKSLGQVEGGPQTVVDALVEAVSPRGTAIFPTHTWDRIGVGRLGVFHLLDCPSGAIGVIPETARLDARAVRSLHPTHSCAMIGQSAEWYAQGHDRSPTPCGVGSPYFKLAMRGGFVLLIGVNHHRNTSIHMIEELALPRGSMTSGPYEMTLVDGLGTTHQRWLSLHDGTERDLMRMEPVFVSGRAQKLVQIGEAECRLLRADLQLLLGLHALRSNPQLLRD